METSHTLDTLFLRDKNWNLIVDLKAISTSSPDLHTLTILSAMLLFHWQNTACVLLFFLHQFIYVHFMHSCCSYIPWDCNPLSILNFGGFCTTLSSPQKGVCESCLQMTVWTHNLVTFHTCFSAFLKSQRYSSICMSQFYQERFTTLLQWVLTVVVVLPFSFLTSVHSTSSSSSQHVISSIILIPPLHHRLVSNQCVQTKSWLTWELVTPNLMT